MKCNVSVTAIANDFFPFGTNSLRHTQLPFLKVCYSGCGRTCLLSQHLGGNGRQSSVEFKGILVYGAISDQTRLYSETLPQNKGR